MISPSPSNTINSNFSSTNTGSLKDQALSLLEQLNKENSVKNFGAKKEVLEKFPWDDLKVKNFNNKGSLNQTSLNLESILEECISFEPETSFALTRQ